MDPNGLDINYMPFPIVPQLHHHTLHMGQHQHPHNTPLLQAQAELSDHLPRRRNRKNELDANKPKKRQRSKKPVDAPTPPKSAYMFFLGEFREQYKIDNPDSKKSSDKAKADYRVIMAEYEKGHPKPPRRQKRARDPTELKRPQSAYFFFLADFREQYKREQPDEATAVKIIGREAGERWKNMSNEDKEPYETQSNASKAEYARMKLLTPAERIMVLAAQAMHHPDGNLLVPQYMAAQLDPSMGMEGTLQQEEEEDQYDNGLEDAIRQDQGDADQDEAPHDSDHLQRLQARYQQEAEGQLAQVLTDGAGPAEADSDSPVGGDAAEQQPPLSPRDDPHGQPSSEVAASTVTPDQAEEQRVQQQAQRHFRPSPDAVPHMPPQLPSQVQQQHHQQMHGVGVGGMVGGVLGHQMQDRGQNYGDAGDDGTTSSQPMAMGLPLNYAQWSNPPSGY
ncbi:hypothetical protein WJX82_010449 [Trebouxia sp. C0006]